jgi:hypothetical protein
MALFFIFIANININTLLNLYNSVDFLYAIVIWLFLNKRYYLSPPVYFHLCRQLPRGETEK